MFEWCPAQQMRSLARCPRFRLPGWTVGRGELHGSTDRIVRLGRDAHAPSVCDGRGVTRTEASAREGLRRAIPFIFDWICAIMLRCLVHLNCRKSEKGDQRVRKSTERTLIAAVAPALLAFSALLAACGGLGGFSTVRL